MFCIQSIPKRIWNHLENKVGLTAGLLALRMSPCRGGWGGMTRAEQGRPLAVGLSLSVPEAHLLCPMYSSWNLKPVHPSEFDVWLRHYPGKMLTWTKFCLQLQVHGLPLAPAVAPPSLTDWSLQSPIFNNLPHPLLQTREQANQDLYTWGMEEASVTWDSGIRVTAWIIAGKTSSVGLRRFCAWSLELGCACNSP